MDIFQALKNDHDEVRELLDQLVEVSEHNQSTKMLLEEIRDQLIPHSRAEEAVFYNPLREVQQAKDRVGHAYNEHLRAEALLRTLQGMEMVGLEWTTLAKKLRDEVNHHIEEEEGALFNMARPLLTENERVQMGKAFEQLKEDVEDQTDFQTTLGAIANMMPPRFADAVRTFTEPRT